MDNVINVYLSQSRTNPANWYYSDRKSNTTILGNAFRGSSNSEAPWFIMVDTDRFDVETLPSELLYDCESELYTTDGVLFVPSAKAGVLAGARPPSETEGSSVPSAH